MKENEDMSKEVTSGEKNLTSKLRKAFGAEGGAEFSREEAELAGAFEDETAEEGSSDAER